MAKLEEEEPKKADGAQDEKSPGLQEKMLKARTIQITGGIDDKQSARVVSELLLLEADDAKKQITIFLNSPGGSVTAGFAIFDTIRFIKPSVRIICNGLTASIATVILLAAKKEDRLSLPNTRLLIHQPLIPMTVYGPASDLEITANEILKTRAKVNALMAAETGQELARIEKDTQRDYWLTAQEAVAYGLLARVITTRAEIS